MAYYNKCGDASSIVLFYTCSYKRQFLQEGIWAIGKVEVKRLPENELGLLNAHFGTSSTLVAVFYRLQKGGTLFYSELYRRVKIRNSFTVCYKISGTEFCGKIMYFVIIKEQPAAVVRRFVTLSIPTEFQPVYSIVPVQYSDRIDIVNVRDIIVKCVYIDVGYSTYVATFPCTLHFD